ncbi:hypothetical protein [Psychrobacter lutiphocae]|uniref:hypothetical protein n=1 Tax=Psychrobacter lutiphocae TaxID=540500 RepID=UPI00036BA253|nr:hypothetical protein [Psychrobacter lutiphocae]
MSTQVYKYSQALRPTIINLSAEQTAGHGDHWRILTEQIEEDVPNWLKKSIDNATIAAGLHPTLSKEGLSHLLLSCNDMCHVNQVLALKDGKPQNFINAFPCVNSPYGLNCKIDRIIANDDTQDAVLRLISADGSIIYAYDQMYTVNRELYRQDQSYFVNFSAWAYAIQLSDQDEVVRVEDPEAIRYHRAYNDIVAKNNGVIPTDLDQQIEQWQPTSDEALEPVEIKLGNMCAYLFGETLGQEDEAWCQGQVLGKQQQTLYERDLTVFDVAILREPDADPFVVRIATPTTDDTRQIIVNDYIQANIWLQAAIYYENQTED